MLDESHLIRAPNFRIMASINGLDHGLFRLEFGRDGSFYVPFPYFVSSEGIAAQPTLTPNRASQDVDIGDCAKVTSNRVKFSYHPNGRVHFSLTGKAHANIGRSSVPLSDQLGHVFSVYIQDVRKFNKSAPKPDAHNLRFVFDSTALAIKIVCFRFPLSRIGLNRPEGEMESPGLFALPDGEGKVRLGCLVAPPIGFVCSEWGFVLIPEQIGALNQETSPLLLFVGGFDPLSQSLDHRYSTSFLALSYPCAGYPELKQRLGSIDIAPVT